MSESDAMAATAERLAADADGATPVILTPEEGAGEALKALAPAQRRWAKANGFRGRLGEILALPGEGGEIAAILFGWGAARRRARGRFHLGRLAERAPAGLYVIDERLIEGGLDAETRAEQALGWLLSRLRFERFRPARLKDARLVAPEGVDAGRIARIADGVALTRRLIDTPAEDMGPAEIEAAARALAAAHGAEIRAVVGHALLAENLPMIHAVGRAAAPGRAPRLIEMHWGPLGAPSVTLVGKGVAFDTGGLGVKPASSMALMKKDMGGAANALGLARMIMAEKLRVRLRVLIPAVENAISAAAFRPGDVLISRKGLSVEVNHTDAEGRLILADALAMADEAAPRTLICLATLTGAARVALGPEVPPFYTDDEALARDLAEAARAARDPIWRMPFWDGYEDMIEPAVADLDNAPSGGMAGSVTAALFLRRFVEKAGAFVHFDIYGWTPRAKPGRPRGGEAQAIRAVFETLAARHGAA